MTTRKNNPKTAPLLGVKISSTQNTEVLKTVQAMLSENKKFLIVTPNPEIISAAQKDKNLLNILNNAEISLPDGVGLLFAAKFLKLPNIERIQGRVFMESIFDLCDERGLKIYLLGSSSSVIKNSIDKLNTNFPNVKVLGSAGPKLSLDALPIGNEDSEIEKSVIREINKQKPHFLFIAFGSPKQEKWWNLHKKELNVNCAMVVGGSLDYYSGQKKIPPAIVSSLGGEWLWRLAHEKGHLRRVYTAVFVFPLLVLKAKIISFLRGYNFKN